MALYKEQEVRQLVDNIAAFLEEKIENDHAVISGLGALYFLLNYHKGNNDRTEQFAEILNHGISSYEISENKLETYAEGFLSYGTLIKLLARNQLYGFDNYDEIITLINDIAIEHGMIHIRDNNFDFLHGTTGIIHYLLLHTEGSDQIEAFITHFIDSLEGNAIPCLAGLCWRDEYIARRENRQVVNMGLAHGMFSILSVLTTIAGSHLKVNKEKVNKLLKGALTFILGVINKNPDSASRFPNFYYLDNPVDDPSRLGWCYGDLTNGYKLLQVGKQLKDEELIGASLTVINHTIARKTPAQTSVEDACLCHGAAGIMHLYNKLYMATGAVQYHNAALFWLDSVIDAYKPKHPYAGFVNTGNDSLKNMGLLNGIAGIGLALDSYLTGDSSWDHILMLNQL
ncbi:lanthionine synthetase LanC family protein [Taibaiella helva]|uniref:lanthionine synthetase LanC family protein n=1 Tax=Taibaiella helva TaxID=2301235 RepID=UPI000E58244C|nr:lanthionine synthetase LanC family protein [Taibaiella helva]